MLLYFCAVLGRRGSAGSGTGVDLDVRRDDLVGVEATSELAAALSAVGCVLPLLEVVLGLVEVSVGLLDGVVSLIQLVLTLVEDSVALVGDVVASVGGEFAFVGVLVPLVSDPVPLVGDAVSLVTDPFPLISVVVPSVGQSIPLVCLAVAFVSSSVAPVNGALASLIIDAHLISQAVTSLGRESADFGLQSPLGFRLDASVSSAIAQPSVFGGIARRGLPPLEGKATHHRGDVSLRGGLLTQPGGDLPRCPGGCAWFVWGNLARASRHRVQPRPASHGGIQLCVAGDGAPYVRTDGGGIHV
jgi:hypothetical protein